MRGGGVPLTRPLPVGERRGGWASADLPARVNNAPQWILKINSSLMVPRQGWQIESIAIQGVR